jgi:acyl-CoA synthetase (AMP-forming)/AMP-acid ligase II
MNFFALLEKQASNFPDKPAILFRDTSITFSSLKESAFKVANGLSSLGVKKTDKVAIFLPNIPEYIYSFLGIFLLRGIVVPLDFMLTEEEVVNFINHSESKLLIAQEKKNIDFMNVKNKCPSLKEVILFEVGEAADLNEKDFLFWDKLFSNKASGNFSDGKGISEQDHSSIFYTSGSTGHPKGVLLNYGHLKNPLDTFEYFIHLTDKDVLLCAAIPFSHLGGLDHVLLMLNSGMTMVLMERFQPFEFLKTIEKYKISIFVVVPSMYVAVLSLKEYDKFDLSSLRYAVVFGAPSSPVLLARFHQQCPNAYLINGWGMTETAAPNAFLATGTNTREIPHTGEFAVGTEAKIVDESGLSLGPNEDGELWIKGKCVMAGYYKEPELTKQVITSDGWLRTGDVARVDNKGRYAIVGRIKDMIKVAGEIVFASEVEEVIHRHPGVSEVAVIGVPDTMRGEVPKAFIVLKEGAALETDELREFLRQHLAHFKIPHHFEFTNLLPKNRVGKIDKEKLKVAVS